MNKVVHLEFSILDLNNIEMYYFQYDYVKQRYYKKENLSCMDKDSFKKHYKTK